MSGVPLPRDDCVNDCLRVAQTVALECDPPSRPWHLRCRKSIHYYRFQLRETV